MHPVLSRSIEITERGARTEAEDVAVEDEDSDSGSATPLLELSQLLSLSPVTNIE
jgi:hypothetical protein